MNHRSLKLNVSDAIEGFLQAKLAEGRSLRTIVGCIGSDQMGQGVALSFGTLPSLIGLG